MTTRTHRNDLRLAEMAAITVRRFKACARYGLVLGCLTASSHWACAEEPVSRTAGVAVVSPTSLQGKQTLRSLLDYALAHNPEVSATAFDGQAAEARTAAARGARLPRLSIEGGYNQYNIDQRLTAARYNGELGVFGDNIATADLVLRLPLFTGGRLVSEVRAAELLEASATQRLARTKNDLVYNISSLFFSVLAQERLVLSLTHATEALASQLERTQALIAARKVAAVDGLRAEVKLADIRQRLLRERNSLSIQRQSLLNLMGAKAASPNFELAGHLNQPRTAPGSVAALTEKALSNRPDVASARSELEAQEARVEGARAGHWPTVNLVGAVGNRMMNNPTQHPVGLSDNDRVTRIGITVEIPIFEGGRTSARVSEERAKLAAQRERFEKLKMQVGLEVSSAHANLASALERLNSTEKAVALAKKVFEIEREKYALARGTQLDVLDAQTALLDAEANHIKALADANTARAQLAWALGDSLQ